MSRLKDNDPAGTLPRDIKDLEYRMTIHLGAMLVVAVGAMAALAKIL